MNPISGLNKLLYMPICRAYARRISGDKHADPVMCFLYSLEFRIMQGYWPHFKRPRSFSEKVWHRMLYSRNPLWTIFSDKWRVRDYVASKVGIGYLVPVIWRGDNPEEIPFDELPLKFVIKATHGCGYNIIVKDKTQLDKADARRHLKKWLSENFSQDRFLGSSWGYKNVRPTIIVESFLDDGGDVPADYKFFCFSGRAEFVQLDFDRHKAHTRVLCDRNLNRLDVEFGYKQYRGIVVRPDNYDDMIRVADSLGENLDFIRVDLYSVGGKVYFGELTCYPAVGIKRFIPRKYDFLFGEKWRMK